MIVLRKFVNFLYKIELLNTTLSKLRARCGRNDGNGPESSR